MEKYISKDAVVAEIERRIQFFTEESRISNSDIVIALFGLKSFLDTLEVKKVDLEKEVNQYFEKTWPFEETDEDIIAFAEYFFELGLKIK